MCLIYWIIWVQVISLKRLLSTEGCRQNSPSIFKDIIQIEVDPPPSHPIFDKFIFDKMFYHVDLPPFPRIFDKNHDILGFEFTFSIILITGVQTEIHRVPWLGQIE